MTGLGRRLDRVEAAIAPRQRVLVYEVGRDVSETERASFERDVLKRRPNDLVIVISDDFLEPLSAAMSAGEALVRQRFGRVIKAHWSVAATRSAESALSTAPCALMTLQRSEIDCARM